VSKWTADWGNNPYDDYNLVLEVLCDDKDIAIIKQSLKGLILKWHTDPKGSTIPIAWLSGLLQAGIRDITDPTTLNEEIHISQWTVAKPTNENNHVRKIYCDGEDVAVIKHSQQGLILEWHSTPNGLIMPVDWLSELLLEIRG